MGVIDKERGVGMVGEGGGVGVICDSRYGGTGRDSRDDSVSKVGRRKEEAGKERKIEGEKDKGNGD